MISLDTPLNGKSATYMQPTWQPIESAPTDGTVILLTDGERFAAGKWCLFSVEPDWMFRWDEPGKIHLPMERIPNPDVGKRHEGWYTFGCSAFSDNVEVETWDGTVYFEPTHWMPLPQLINRTC